MKVCDSHTTEYHGHPVEGCPVHMEGNADFQDPFSGMRDPEPVVASLHLTLETLSFIADMLEVAAPKDEVTKDLRKLQRLCDPKPHFYAYFERKTE